MKPISRGVFRAYDIRGIVDRDFDEQWVRTFGRAAGTYFRSKGWDRAVVGHDVRPSSSVYQAELAAGLCEAGVDVFLLGHTSTPLFYFAVRHLGCQAGIMVTASHNPPEYNGFKVWGGRTALAPQGIAELYETMAAGVFATGAGLASCHDILPAYVAELSQGMRLPRPVKVVLDGGNGSAGELTADFLELCGATVVRQYCDPDPTFPNHHPDPVVPANMVDLMARVPAEGAELGIGLDGDGDRIGVVDEQGRLLMGDQLAAIFARHFLATAPGSTILGDLKCSNLFFQDVERHGGKAVMAVTGHSLMKAQMLDSGAIFGGEFSGHMFFGELGGTDDATWAALRIVSIVAANAELPLSRYLEDWPVMHSTPEVHVPCPDQQKFQVIEGLQKYFRAVAAGGECTVIDLDGVRVMYEDGWALARASNTQPVIVLRFEAVTQERLAWIRSLMEQALMSCIKDVSG